MFSYKIYNLDGTRKDVINITDVKNLISFSANENGGQGQLTLLLDYKFSSSKITNTDFIKVYLKDTLIYTGIVQDVKRKITNNYDQIEIPLLGLGTLPSYFLYKDTGVYTFSKNQDPSQTIRDIIDYINTVYTAGWLSYDASSIIDYGTLINIDFDNDTCLKALEKCIEATDYKFFIDKDGKVYFRAKPISATHNLTVGKDIEEIKLEEDSEKMVNKLVLEWKAGTTIYEDLTSQSTYGLREKFISKTDLVDSTSADEYGNNYIATYKNPINKTSIIINDEFNLENIKVSDTIKVKNFDFTIDNLQIVKYNYSVDKMVLDLELFDSFGKEVIS